MSKQKGEPAKRGRPSKFTAEVAAEICERLANGEPLAKICRDEHMPNASTVWDWEQADEPFSQRLSRAREVGCDAIALDALEIADESTHDVIVNEDGSERTNGEVVARSKLRVDTRMKLLGCWSRRYGTQRTEVDVSGKLEHDASKMLGELGSLLEAAMKAGQ